MCVEFAVLHECEQPIWRANRAIEVARGIVWVDVLSVTLEMGLAHLRERPRRR